MIPAFTLTRSMEIHVTRFAGEVAKEEKRPELMPFLLMARDTDGITSASAAGHLLGAREGRRQIAQRLLEQLKRSGALEAQGNEGFKLTEAGHEALKKEAVFIAERGSWEVWHTSDPLLPHNLIQLTDYSESKAFDEVRHDAPKRNTERPHTTLDALKGLPLAPIMGGQRQRIDDLPNNVERLTSKTGTLTWEVAKKSLSLKVGEKSFDLPAPELSHKATFEALLETAGLTSDWDTEAEVLHRDFANLPDESRRDMSEDITFARPVQLLDYGNFDQTTVRRIEINTRNHFDADAWAAWRLEDSIDEVACSRRFEAWCAQAAAPFAAFASLRLPSRAVLAARTRPVQTGAPLSAVAWNLTAAEDWNL